MERKAYVRATKPGLIFGLIFIAAFLGFGIWFFSVLREEGSEVGMVFMAFWILVVLLMGAGLVHNLKVYNQKAERSLADEIVLPDVPADGAAAESVGDFEAKLRRLESLRKDGIITAEEYAAKRAEIMGRKW